MDENLLLIGKITKPHGVRGKVKVLSYAESAETFQNLDKVFIKKRDGSCRPLHINSVGGGAKLIILGFDEAGTREEAEEMAGCDLYIDKDDLESLPPGEYYRYQLVGLDVVTTEGMHLGRIEEIIETGSNDVLVVRKDGEEHLVPALKDLIREVDLEGGRMVIEPMEYES